MVQQTGDPCGRPRKALRQTCHSEPRSGEESREQKVQCKHTGSFTYTLPRMPFAGLLRNSPQSGAAAEIAGRLPLPPAAAARNSQDDSFFASCKGQAATKIETIMDSPGVIAHLLFLFCMLKLLQLIPYTTDDSRIKRRRKKRKEEMHGPKV